MKFMENIVGKRKKVRENLVVSENLYSGSHGEVKIWTFAGNVPREILEWFFLLWKKKEKEISNSFYELLERKLQSLKMLKWSHSMI